METDFGYMSFQDDNFSWMILPLTNQHLCTTLDMLNHTLVPTRFIVY